MCLPCSENRSSKILSGYVYFILITLLLLSATFFSTANKASAAVATLSWDDPNEPGNADGFYVYCESSSGSYNLLKDVQYATSYTFLDLQEGESYYFAVQSYSTDGLESDLSSEVLYTVPYTDSDGDGLTDLDEINIYGTDPYNIDTDGDGLLDPEELNVYDTDPINVDSDGDSLPDGEEINLYGTDPNNFDTDGDGVDDDKEILYGLDPLVPGDNQSEELDRIQDVIIDNGDADTSFIGNWTDSSSLNYYGSVSVYGKNPGDAYSFKADISGTYELSIWWTEHSNRSAQVPIEIYDGDRLLDEVYVDQTTGGGQWNMLGTYSFAGAARVVIVSDTNDYSACADAVKFTFVSPQLPPSEIVIDNGDIGTDFSGTWTNSSSQGYYGNVSVYGKNVGDTYSFEASAAGIYELSIWWTEHSNRSAQVPIEIYDGDRLLDEVYVDQTTGGGQWNMLGTYSFAGAARVVIVSDTNDYSACADAVKFTIHQF